MADITRMDNELDMNTPEEKPSHQHALSCPKLSGGECVCEPIPLEVYDTPQENTETIEELESAVWDTASKKVDADLLQRVSGLPTPYTEKEFGWLLNPEKLDSNNLMMVVDAPALYRDIERFISSRDTYWKERQTFLGDLFGVPIFAETREEVKLQAINKWLEEARMKMMQLTPITNEDNLK